MNSKTQQKPLVLFVMSNQADNLGDTVLNRNLVGILNDFGTVILDDSKVSLDYAADIGIPPENCLSQRSDLPNPRKIFGLLQLLFGKQPFTFYARSPGHLTPRHGLVQNFKSFLRGLLFARLRQRGISILLLGVTITHSRLSGLTAKLWRWQARNHKLFSVRDRKAYEHLKELGFDNVQHIPDLFFLTDLSHIPKRPPDAPTKIIVNLRPSFPNNQRETEYSSALITQIHKLYNDNPDALFVFCHQVETDAAFMAKLYESFTVNSRIEYIDQCLNDVSAPELYGTSSAIVSNRLHCLMYGVLLGLPAIALTDIENHTKIADAWKEYSLNDILIDCYSSRAIKTSFNNQKANLLVHSKTLKILEKIKSSV